MHSKQQPCSLVFHTTWCPALAIAIAIALTIALALTLTQSAQAQTYTVLYNFTGGQDGAYPEAGLTMDRSGNLYGTAYEGGASNRGSVYKLAHRGGGWVFSPLYNFTG